MKNTLTDIVSKLRTNAYSNEEQVRIAIVCRLLLELGWNVWNPKEVHAEYVPVKTEDSTRVDLALFASPQLCIYIEVKMVGRLSSKLADFERQLRDYNRNLTAVFSILTDGQKWRFYLSRAGGDFSKKMFLAIDILSDELDEVEHRLTEFLNKNSISSGLAEREAAKYLQLSQIQRVMNDQLIEARRLTQVHPYPTLPDALTDLIREAGFDAESTVVIEFLDARRAGAPVIPPAAAEDREPTTIPAARPTFLPDGGEVLSFSPGRPPSLQFAKIESARFGRTTVFTWAELLREAVKHALRHGMVQADFQRIGATVGLREGDHVDGGYKLLQGTNFSLQGMNSSNCYWNAYLIAKHATAELAVTFRWSDQQGAAHPGRRGRLEFAP